MTPASSAAAGEAARYGYPSTEISLSELPAIYALGG
jgi:hypothetical protein